MKKRLYIMQATKRNIIKSYGALYFDKNKETFAEKKTLQIVSVNVHPHSSPTVIDVNEKLIREWKFKGYEINFMRDILTEKSYI